MMCEVPVNQERVVFETNPVARRGLPGDREIGLFDLQSDA